MKPRSLHGAVCLSAVLSLFLLGSSQTAAVAQERGGKKNEQPKTTLGKLVREKERARGMISNTQARLRGKVVSLTGENPDATEAQICCSVNIERIEKRVMTMGPLMRELEACYVDAGDVDGQLQIRFVRADAEALFKATRDFRDAKDGSVQFYFGAMTRTFLTLDKSITELAECPAARDESD
jgi:hypothetical protein